MNRKWMGMTLLMASLMGTSALAGEATLTLQKDSEQNHAVSEDLYGIFLEDINFAVDGGLYPQMIKNGSFEYGALAKDTNKHNYSVTDASVSFEIVDGSADGTALNENNTHYAVLTNTSTELQGIANKGYHKGMSVKEGEDYVFGVYLKAMDGYNGKVTVSLTDGKDNVYLSGEIDGITDTWQKYEVTMTAAATAEKGLRMWFTMENGSMAVDMMTLSPVERFGKSGIRKDLGEYLQALEPAFVRFPGGCVVEGTSFDNQYNWKDSIGNGVAFDINGETVVGDVAARKTGLNIWHKALNTPYYTTHGIGFYEYFLLCEDLGSMPVPILNAGMTCPIQSGDGYTYVEEDSPEFAQYVQDALDLVEFCRGGADTEWGAVRIAMGHEEPFPLHYIGIGNEQWQPEYYSHYERFKEAFAEAEEKDPEMYGDLELIIGTGPLSSDRYAWDVIAEKGSDYAGLVDEHYYEEPDWFLQNVDRYDSYQRDSVPVFLGEYAAKHNSMESALAEAAYLTGVERNSDIVKMACYAPLFGNDTSNQWEPDMIFYDNYSAYGTVNYYVQQMFGANIGSTYITSELSEEAEGIFSSVTEKEDGTLIMKLVNTTEQACSLTVNGLTKEGEAACTTLTGTSKKDVNTQKEPTTVIPQESTVELTEGGTVEIPALTVMVITLAI